MNLQEPYFIFNIIRLPMNSYPTFIKIAIARDLS